MSAVDEFALDRSLAALDEATRTARRELLAKRSEVEDAEFVKFRTASDAAKPEEQIDRTSGDKAWRESRGELGATSSARAEALARSESGIQDARKGSFVALELDELNDGESTDDLKVLAHFSALDERLKSVHVSCQWKDQDFGNQKGVMHVCLVRGGAELVHEDLFGICRADGREGWKKVERHLGETAAIVGQAQPGDIIYIKYRVGGGGGHSFHVRNFRCQLELATQTTCATPTGPGSAGSGGYGEQPWAARAKRTDVQELVKKIFAEAVAAGMPKNEAAAHAVLEAQRRTS